MSRLSYIVCRRPSLNCRQHPVNAWIFLPKAVLIGVPIYYVLILTYMPWKPFSIEVRESKTKLKHWKMTLLVRLINETIVKAGSNPTPPLTPSTVIKFRRIEILCTSFQGSPRFPWYANEAVLDDSKRLLVACSAHSEYIEMRAKILLHFGYI